MPASLVPAAGTVSFYQGVTYQGLARSVLFIRPSMLPSNKSPAIVLLHGQGGTPEDIANNARAGTLAAQMGYWVILPPAINGQWNINPANASPTADDVGFLKTLIQTATQQYPIDPTRVSMAGMSDGGFMATRVACEQSQLLASVVAVAAEMLSPMAKVCRPSHPVPMIFVMGTADPIVPYNGSSLFIGALQTFNAWASYGACNPKQTSTQKLPVTLNDGTSVTLQHNAACGSHGEVDLYSVVNGGHAWPGGAKMNGTNGIISANLNTTNMIGNFAKLWTNKSTN